MPPVTKRIVRGAVKMVAIGPGTVFFFVNRLRGNAAGILVAWRLCDAYKAFWVLLVGILTFGPNGHSAQIPAPKIAYLADHGQPRMQFSKVPPPSHSRSVSPHARSWLK
jgi:hypothetical protein